MGVVNKSVIHCMLGYVSNRAFYIKPFVDYIFGELCIKMGTTFRSY